MEYVPARSLHEAIWREGLPRFLAPEAPMLAGQGGPLARSMPAADLVAALAAETDEALARLTH